MGNFPKSLEILIERFSKFPGIGKRTAERLAFYVLKMNPQDIEGMAHDMMQVSKFIKSCSLCNNFTTDEVCSICSNTKRNKEYLCIVQEPKDVLAVEKTSRYNGFYYVLLGAISPLNGVGPQDLNIGKLLNKLSKGEIKEVIISTNPDNDGELTAQFLVEKISKFKVKIYRIGIGIPLGTQIEYIDSATLGKAIIERKIISK